MAIEQTELFDFIAGIPPFDRLTAAQQSRLVNHLSSLYISQNNQSALLSGSKPALYIVRSAVLDQLDDGGDVVGRLEQGDCFGQAFALGEADSLPALRVQSDGLLYRLPAPALQHAMESNAGFARWFQQGSEQPLLRQVGLTASDADVDWTQQTVATVSGRRLVAIEAERSIQSAAELMADEGVSCLPVMLAGALVGLITDRDLRTRVLAVGLDPQRPVRDIMTTALLTLDARQSLFDALVLMSQHNIHHVPILDAQRRPQSVLTSTDLQRQQRNEPLVFIKALHRAGDRAALVALAEHLPEQIRRYARNARDAATAGRLLSAVTDTLTRRLLWFWHAEHGPPPAAYAWVAFGSEAREDQTLFSDQDNGLLLANGVSSTDKAWFLGMAEYVCQGLADCGIRLCPGNVMAMNPHWCLTADEWKQQFRQWVDEPTPEGVLHSMIFFDSRCIAGDAELYQLHRQTVAELAQQPRFLAALAGHVAGLPVPLGLFDRLLTQHTHGQVTVDLKTNGIAVLNDIVRLHTLQAGLTVASTAGRLRELADSPVLARSDMQNLLDAWQFLAAVRLRWQVSDDVDTAAPNAMRPDWLSGLERQQLKAALRVIRQSQRGAAQTFRMGY